MTQSNTLDAPTRQGLPASDLHSRWKTRAAATILVLGGFGVVLAGVPSTTFDLERYLVPKALVLHMTALLLLVLGFPSLRAPRWGVVEWMVIAFVGAGAVSTLLAANRWLAFSAWGIGVSSVVLLLGAQEVAARYRWRVLGGLLCAAVLGAALGIAQAYGLEWEWLASDRPPGGTFGNRNFLAHLSVLALAPLAVVVARTRRSRWLLIPLAGLAALTTVVVLTRSRAAWLGGIGGVASASLALLLSRSGARPSRKRVVAAGVALMLAVGAAVTVPNRLQWTTDSPYAETLSRLTAYDEGSGRGRLIQYRNSLEMAKSAPVWGVGPGNWFVHYPRVTQEGDPAYAGHLSIPTNPWPSSDWVAFLSERGVLGMLLLLTAGVTAVGRGLAAARNGFTEEAQAGAALVALLVTAVVSGAFDAVLLLAAPSYLVWAGAGLLLPEPRRPVEWPPLVRPRRWPRVLWTLLVLGLLADSAARTAAIVITGSGRSERRVELAARIFPGEHRLQLMMAERGDCAAVSQAEDLMPYHANVLRMAERCSR